MKKKASKKVKDSEKDLKKRLRQRVRGHEGQWTLYINSGRNCHAKRQSKRKQRPTMQT